MGQVVGAAVVVVATLGCVLSPVLSSPDADSSDIRSFNIGGILSDTESDAHFKLTISQQINVNRSYVDPNKTLLKDVTMLMDSNPIRTALDVCKKLVSKSVYAVVVSHPLNGDLSPAAVSYTSGFYHIPVIGISSRDSAFSDKNIHVSFLRTVPPYSHQADVWVELLKTFQYTQVVFVHSSDTDGRALLTRFQNQAQSHEDDKDIKMENVIEFEPGLNSFVDKLKEMREASARVILLYANKEDAGTIFHDASYMNMTGRGYVWVVTEQALNAEHVPAGAIGLKLVNASDEDAHITDSLYILAMAIKKLRDDDNTTTEQPPQDCNNTGTSWETGKKLFQYILEQVLKNGLTGKVAFDENGDRINAEYDVINIQEFNETTGLRKEHVPVGQYKYNKTKETMTLEINENAIVWPGNTTIKPQGYMIPTRLKVLTIEEKPFVTTQKIESKAECLGGGRVLCPWYNSSGEGSDLFCCTGYCIDLLNTLANKINFTFELALSPDGQFGSLQMNENTGKKEWTGLIGQLVNQTHGADMIVAPLTINPERAQVIEFSKPFKYQGITILERKQPRYSTLVSFLQPFRNTLWILVMVSVHVVALVLYLLDRFSPFGRYKLANMDGTEEDALNLSSAIWFAWGVLLNSGIGEGTPRSFSARVLGMVWAGFAMIIVASYTANLAAFLVLDRPQTSLTGINDARLRNPMENFTYATVKGSSVDMYFRRQVELSNMYRTMEGNNYPTAEAAITAVKSGKLKAFIWDSSRLEYEAAQDCELVTAGELFGRSGYGIGLKKNSPWADRVTLAILEFHESGYMEELDNKWILQNQEDMCNTDEKAPATLGLKNMAGVFILVAAGIVGGIGLIIIEIIYKKHQIRKQKRLEIARHAADKWRGAVEKRKTLRASMMMQRRLKANGVNEPSVICVNVESGSGAGSGVGGAAGTGAGAGVGAGAAVVSSASGAAAASIGAADLPRMLPPPPPAPLAPPSPPGLPPDVPPAPPAPRWGNDIRQRHVSAQDEGLPPPPPPPAGVDTMRLHASYKNLFGPDPPDLVA
ncbi:glutamate [NMDA] receptor subunit 1 isoform X3 [Procambarus clarkii]|uniref:glutamate [NMDA] receptor subunit 1 isoform X3 n=1 Tax=Procambarus clarkii TaxID=6728 RepID=UPI001E6768DC|nr:glutamate [NMDA] receptor subunit 1-like isoform X3 [Procambarus clarkii]